MALRRAMPGIASVNAPSTSVRRQHDVSVGRGAHFLMQLDSAILMNREHSDQSPTVPKAATFPCTNHRADRAQTRSGTRTRTRARARCTAAYARSTWLARADTVTRHRTRCATDHCRASGRCQSQTATSRTHRCSHARRQRPQQRRRNLAVVAAAARARVSSLCAAAR